MNNNLFNLSDKVAVVTGGAGLMGSKHIEALAELGAIVYLLDISKKEAIKTKNKINKIYDNSTFFIHTNITNEKNIIDSFKYIKKKHKKVDILINNAALNPKAKIIKKKYSNKLENFNLNNWQKELDVGLTGAFLCSKIFGYDMSKNKKGVIINISSDLGIIAPDQRIYKDLNEVKPVTYSVIKHGIIGLTKYIATYWGKDGVRANTLCPGGIYDNQPKKFVNKLKKLIPMNRMANVDEYKASIQFLSSDASSYMNGATIVIDGGRTIW